MSTLTWCRVLTGGRSSAGGSGRDCKLHLQYYTIVRFNLLSVPEHETLENWTDGRRSCADMLSCSDLACSLTVDVYCLCHLCVLCGIDRGSKDSLWNLSGYRVLAQSWYCSPWSQGMCTFYLVKQGRYPSVGPHCGDSGIPAREIKVLWLGRRLGQGHTLCTSRLLRHAHLAGVLFASQLLGQRPSLYIAACSSGHWATTAKV